MEMNGSGNDDFPLGGLTWGVGTPWQRCFWARGLTRSARAALGVHGRGCDGLQHGLFSKAMFILNDRHKRERFR